MAYEFLAEINAGLICIKEKKENCGHKIRATSRLKRIISFYRR